MSDIQADLQALYSRHVAGTARVGAIGAVSDLLTSGTLDRNSFDDVVASLNVDDSRAFRIGLLDLLLHAVRTALRDHSLTPNETALVRYLSTIFRVREGELFQHRRRELAELLQIQTHRILSDAQVDPEEEVHQQELQRILGLSYDQFLELTRDAVTPIVDGMIERATMHGPPSDDDRTELDRQLARLRTVYTLSSAQRQALGRD